MYKDAKEARRVVRYKEMEIDVDLRSTMCCRLAPFSGERVAIVRASGRVIS